MAYSILVVEDNADQKEFIDKSLRENGYNVFSAGDGMTAIKIVEKTMPDLALLDIELPDISGESLCKEIKKINPQIPVIFLTAQSTSSNIVHGLDIGADDYMTKPFVVEELLARIHARFRQENKTNSSLLQIGELTLNRKTFEVKRGDKKITLTPKEYKLLEYFMVNKNQVLTRDQILTTIWQYHYEVESRVVDIYVGMLRKKIDSGFKKKFINSVRGFGYVLKDS